MVPVRPITKANPIPDILNLESNIRICRSISKTRGGFLLRIRGVPLPGGCPVCWPQLYHSATEYGYRRDWGLR